jgi:hypothetical protein
MARVAQDITALAIAKRLVRGAGAGAVSTGGASPAACRAGSTVRETGVGVDALTVALRQAIAAITSAGRAALARVAGRIARAAMVRALVEIGAAASAYGQAVGTAVGACSHRANLALCADHPTGTTVVRMLVGIDTAAVALPKAALTRTRSDRAGFTGGAGDVAASTVQHLAVGVDALVAASCVGVGTGASAFGAALSGRAGGVARTAARHVLLQVHALAGADGQTRTALARGGIIGSLRARGIRGPGRRATDNESHQGEQGELELEPGKGHEKPLLTSTRKAGS